MLTYRSRTGGRGARRKPGGFTLAEVLVAIAVFAIVVAIAMTLYQQLQKNFKQGENAAAQQQNTRVAFDRLVSDLRMAGFNYNPDGDATRPDEQIEGMWDHAVAIRGDFDRETADANSPESSLGGPSAHFRIVSTGNDEIVTYALGKPLGTGGTSISFGADVSAVPRDGTEETLTIDNVYLDMNSPPYTLYRITLKPGGTALSSMPDKQPLADNVRSMTFTYYDGVGNVLGTMAGGSDAAADITLRQKIARIGVHIVGMTQDPDLAYFDPADTNPASRHYRKFDLASDVVPRNLGFVGAPDLDVDNPNTPTGLAVCPGHCKGLWTTWTANDPAEGVVKYEVTYGATMTAQGNAQDVAGTTVYIDGLNPTGSYVVGVGAVDGVGNMSDPRAYSGSTAMLNTTYPNPATALAGTSVGAGNAVANRVEIGWTAPTINTPATALGCDHAPSTPLRDLAGYRLYRGATASFDPNIPSQVQASWDPNQLSGADPDPNIADTSVVNCRTYYYKTLAEDRCGLRSTVTSSPSASASTSVPPAAPSGVAATDLGLNTTLLNWSPVTLDTSPTPATVLIDSYRIYRAAVPTGNDPNTASYTLLHDGPVASISSPSYTDPNVPSIPSGRNYYYRVSARDDCPNNESALSVPALLSTCDFGGTVHVAISPGGNPVSGVQTITVTVSGGVTPSQGALTIRDTSTGTLVFGQTSATYPYTFTWNTATPPAVVGHDYDVVAAVTNSSGCTEMSTQTVGLTGTTACCIQAANPRVTNNTALGSVGGGTKNNEISFDIINACGADITIEQMMLFWTNKLGNSPQLTAWVYGAYPAVVLSPAVNPIGGAAPVADFDLRNPPFTTYPLTTAATPLNPVNVAYVFTKAMAGKISGKPIGNEINTEYLFRQSSTGSTGTCTVRVIADTTTPGISLCDPTVDPNCPGF